MSEIKYAVCHLSAVPLRASHADTSEIVSYILFGECLKLSEQHGSWVKVITALDGYEGWMDIKQCRIITSSEFDQYTVYQYIMGLGVTHPVRHSSGDLLYLFTGSKLPQIENNTFILAGEEYTFPEPPSLISREQEIDVCDAARFFLHAPYLWGGRTICGIDCSGFTQLVFSICGKKLMRDASQQAEQGVTVDFIQEACAGDLAFFDNAEGKITHVGIMLNNHEIIHASGRVKIDKIDNEGIYSRDLNKYTHKLRIIRRLH